MREIKFRAWHKKEKIMIAPVIQLHLDQMPFIGWYETTHDALEGNLTTAFLDEVELQEYTGLRDRNGREIYEGDVVAIDCDCGSEYPCHHPPAINVVTFDKGSASFIFTTANGRCGEDFDESYDVCWSVIGNIYENPELLEAVK